MIHHIGMNQKSDNGGLREHKISAVVNSARNHSFLLAKPEGKEIILEKSIF